MTIGKISSMCAWLMFMVQGVTSAAEVPVLAGEWTLQVENPAHQAIATLQVEFTNRPASSCMAGEWRVVKVDSAKSTDQTFFPVSDPLSWRVSEGQLTVGRNEICDAYLWLQGDLAEKSVQGSYFSLGMGGGSPLGFFTLDRRE